MRFLVDECCSRSIIDALSAAGHDVLVAQAMFHSASDRTLAAFAIAEGRVVVSEDFDFGELAVREGLAIPGVILVSIAAPRASEKVTRLAWLIESDPDILSDHLTILYAESVRRRRLR